MTLPFSHDAFLDVFGAYNAAFWLEVALLWLATATAALAWLFTGRLDRRVLFPLLAVHWVWSGLAYHWLFFRAINPAAAVFAALFVIEGAVFAWLAVTGRGEAILPRGPRGVLAAALVTYALVYPLAGLGFGLEYPRMPVFAVPCPTTLATAGFLIASRGVPRVASIVPALWAIIGGSAAFLLGIRADLALVVAAVLLVLDVVAPNAMGRRQTA